MIYYCEKFSGSKKNTLNQIKFLIGLVRIIFIILVFLLLIISLLVRLDNLVIIDGFFNNKNKKNVFYKEGVVDHVFVQEGDVVQKSQPLIIFNNFKPRIDLHIITTKIRHALLYNFNLLNKLHLISLIPPDYFSLEFKIILDYMNSEIRQLFYIYKFLFHIYEEFIFNSFYHNIVSTNYIIYDISLCNKKIILINININLLRDKYILLSNKFHSCNTDLTEIKIELLKLNTYILEEKFSIYYCNFVSKELILKKLIFLNDQSINLISEYKKNYFELTTLEKQFLKLTFSYKNTIILSPISGVINNISVEPEMHVHNKSIIEIVPQDKDLLIEGFVPLGEIDGLFIGNFVKVNINTYSLRHSVRIIGKIIYISSDKISNGNSHSTYYKVKILVCNEELNKHKFSIYPSLPVKIFIIKDKKSILEYFLSPIKIMFYNFR